MASSTFTTDLTHTEIGFATKHMMVTAVRGRFKRFAGTVLLDEENPANSSGTFTVDVASIDTGAERRDGHLRTADFFDVEQNPQMTFRSTRVEPAGGQDYRVTGDLTIRGITRPVTFAVEFLGLYAGMGGARRAGFHATATINREDWGLTWNMGLETGGWLVGKEVRLEIELAVEEAKAATTVGREVPAAA
jgi:polyisoprenoid-binding protein YceI